MQIQGDIAGTSWRDLQQVRVQGPHCHLGRQDCLQLMHHGIAGGTFQRAMIQQVIWDQLTGHQINSQRPVVCTVRILRLLQDLEIPSQGRIGAYRLSSIEVLEI